MLSAWCISVSFIVAVIARAMRKKYAIFISEFLIARKVGFRCTTTAPLKREHAKNISVAGERTVCMHVGMPVRGVCIVQLVCAISLFAIFFTENC